MKPVVNSNFEKRAECIGRRGLSLVKTGLYREAIAELEVAIKMKPDDHNLKIVLEEAQTNLGNLD